MEPGWLNPKFPIRTQTSLTWLSQRRLEAVAKFRVVETNDDGKTDLKDPHIIKTLAGKTLRQRQLPKEYQLLRTCGVLYDQAERGPCTNAHRWRKAPPLTSSTRLSVVNLNDKRRQSLLYLKQGIVAAASISSARSGQSRLEGAGPA